MYHHLQFLSVCAKTPPVKAQKSLILCKSRGFKGSPFQSRQIEEILHHGQDRQQKMHRLLQPGLRSALTSLLAGGSMVLML